MFVAKMQRDNVVSSDVLSYCVAPNLASPFDKARLRNVNKSCHRKIKDPLDKMRAFALDKQLLKAAKYGEQAVCHVLIRKGADLDWGLYGAAKGGHFELCTFFIANGAQLTNCDICHLVEITDRDDVVIFLLSKLNIDINEIIEHARFGHSKHLAFLQSLQQ